MSDPSGSHAAIAWRPVAVRAFAHHVITTADEIREITPLLRAVARLRVPAHHAERLQAALAELHHSIARLDCALVDDTKELWASADASEATEATVERIMTRPAARRHAQPSRDLSAANSSHSSGGR